MAAGDEVGRKDRRVPAGDEAGREVEADHGVDGENQRVARPARRRYAVSYRCQCCAEPSSRGQHPYPIFRILPWPDPAAWPVRDQPDVPEEERDRGVGRDGEDVPDQGTPRLRQMAMVFG